MWMFILLLFFAQNYDQPCVNCHKDLLQAKYQHEVAEECDSCHVETKKHTFEPFTDESLLETCLTCHDDKELKHPPDGGLCTDCHNPHASSNDRLLVEPVPELCWGCHEQSQAVVSVHPPYEDGECTQCHNPHGTDTKPNLVQSLPNLCFECHDDIQEKVEQENPHPPAEESCTDCHSPHASNFERLLKYYMVRTFYANYTLLKYDLCFQCHDRDDVFGEGSEFVLPDGKNLHAVHVKRQKGRTCLVCHDVHGSHQSFMLRGMIPFGPYWYIPLRLSQDNGKKTCQPACHQKVTFGRGQ